MSERKKLQNIGITHERFTPGRKARSKTELIDKITVFKYANEL